MQKPPANVLELPLDERALMALTAATEKVWEEHARRGPLIHVWSDGQVAEVSPEEMRMRLWNRQ
jgi:hypothetical protein